MTVNVTGLFNALASRSWVTQPIRVLRAFARLGEDERDRALGVINGPRCAEYARRICEVWSRSSMDGAARLWHEYGQYCMRSGERTKEIFRAAGNELGTLVSRPMASDDASAATCQDSAYCILSIISGFQDWNFWDNIPVLLARWEAQAPNGA
jgi:hypothetical protein